ncbi:uncharacterized protein J8A68_004842 [[Candida] subhashii]|uniref:AB hydrolase-1 domain-containing protein n=1 Tax=[Candida] subhashii TaxID=561895 RepID=A0A8J5QGF1_9ASCO|nr:uncharacterized protein J8A68_004842 [[Candida] subhashii]KAG7661689.1 hypothetical protein J8A68_004842 [[Candida] subhashii]
MTSINDIMSESSTMSESSSQISITSSQTSTSSTTTSISFYKSFQDWWNSSSSYLSQQPPPPPLAINEQEQEDNIESPEIKNAKFKNRMIEYELYLKLLPNDIHIYKPNEVIPNQPSAIFGQLLDIKLNNQFIIHEFSLENNTNPPDVEIKHIVIIHGYMAASGYFINNIVPLIYTPGIRIHIIDLPGFGNSSRPSFPNEFLSEPNTISEKIGQILKIENWFIDRIEQWRLVRRIDKFKLICHSMGAYLGCCYLMKYNKQPKLVDEVVIVSPMGTESSHNSLLLNGNRKTPLNHDEPAGDPFKEVFEEEQPITEELQQFWTMIGQPRFPKNIILKTLWQNNKTPFDILQKLGPFYSKILSYWSFQRFKNLVSTTDDPDSSLILKLHDYSYSIFNQYQLSGELAITKFINHEILARLPLYDRGLVDYLVTSNVKSLWVYGDHDWMNSNGGKHIYEKICEHDPNLAQFEIIESAGHHVYLDNPKVFNKICIDFFGLNPEL